MIGIYTFLGAKTAVGFLVGAAASFIAGYVGMRVSVLANVRTAEAAKGGLAPGLSMAFKGGAVTGMMHVINLEVRVGPLDQLIEGLTAVINRHIHKLIKHCLQLGQ